MSDGFRFQQLEVWQRAAAVTSTLFQLADDLERAKLYRIGEQLRAATLSITTNIAEGSGSTSQADFRNFLNMARRSVFEVANMLIILTRENRLPPTSAEPLSSELEQQSRMLISFMRSLQ